MYIGIIDTFQNRKDFTLTGKWTKNMQNKLLIWKFRCERNPVVIKVYSSYLFTLEGKKQIF